MTTHMRDGDTKYTIEGAVIADIPGDDVTTIVDDVDCRVCLTVYLRHVREDLGLSRADVTKATGMSDSVVWRSEQAHRKITDEQRVQLLEFYAEETTRQQDLPKQKKQSGSKQKKQSLTALLPTDVAFEFIDALDALVSDLIINAQQKKRAVSDLRAVQARIIDFKEETK